MNLYELLARVRSHATTDGDAEWLENEFDHFGLLLDCHNQHYRDLLASWEENARLRKLLRPIWQRTFAETFRPEIPDDRLYKVWLTAGELRAIAALFVEDDE